MLDSPINKVVRLTIATTSEQLQRILATVPHGVRFGVARDLDETGEAFRFESSRHCAYYLRRLETGIVVWRWSYVASDREALRLRALIASLEGSLSPRRANSVFEHATQRSVSNPRPKGMELHALDFGGLCAG
jgi:hypothetical protein